MAANSTGGWVSGGWTTRTGLSRVNAKHEEIIEQAKKDFEIAEQWEANTRILFEYDYKFAEGDSHNNYQWDASIYAARNADDRPCLTINKVQQHNLQIINDAKQNKPGIRIRPVGDQATFDAAQIFQDIIYHIEYISGAENVYDNATEFQVKAGFGYWRVNTEYISENSFDQEAYIRRIKDPRSVYLDPYINEIDGLDARHGFIFEDVPKDLFKKQYPKHADIASQTVLGNAGSNQTAGWITNNTVRVAEYFVREEKEDLLVTWTSPVDGEVTLSRESLLDDTKKLILKELKGNKQAQQMWAYRERDVLTQNVKWYKIAGNQIIDETDWLGKYIPIVRLIGSETVIDGILDRKGHTRALINAQQMYNYNCLDLDTKLPTPTGWTTIRDVKEGDYLIDDKGLPTQVIGISPININRQCFQITFDNGEKIIADETHLWTVEERGKRKAQTWDWQTKTITTKELEAKKHFIKVVNPVSLPEVKLPIHPYILGIWLGDGGTGVNSITSGLEDAMEMQKLIAECGYNAGDIRVNKDKTATNITIHGLRNELIENKLLGNKHIPEIYFRASKEQRELLVQGLMDTDGCISKQNRQCIFVNTNVKLIHGIRELLASIGVKSKIETVKATARKFPSGETYNCQEAYRVTFTANADQPLFKLPRKREIQLCGKNPHWRRTKRHSIVSIVEIPSIPVKCLTVDSPSKLFLAGEGWIPTHNTSANIEFGALQTKSPYVAASESISGYEEYYQTANTANHSYLPYNAYDELGNSLPAPERAPPPQASPAYVQSMQIANQEMMMASGQYQAQFGEQENAKSGIAINARQRQGDRATYHFIDNQAIAIRATGKILIDLIPKIYDTERILKITTREGAIRNIKIDPNAKEAYQKLDSQQMDQGKLIEEIVFNPKIGMYDIQSDVGPSFATRRQDAFNAMMQLAASMGEKFMGIGGDLLFKVAEFPESDILAERWRKSIPPNITGDGIPAPLEEAMNLAAQQIEELRAELAEKDLMLKNKEGNLALAAMKQEFEQQIKTIQQQLDEKVAAVREIREDYKAYTQRMKDLFNTHADGSGIDADLVKVKKQLVKQMLEEPEPNSEELLENETNNDDEPPMEGARKAPDGRWYIENPEGGFSRIDMQ